MIPKRNWAPNVRAILRKAFSFTFLTGILVGSYAVMVTLMLKDLENSSRRAVREEVRASLSAPYMIPLPSKKAPKRMLAKVHGKHHAKLARKKFSHRSKRHKKTTLRSP